MSDLVHKAGEIEEKGGDIYRYAETFNGSPTEENLRKAEAKLLEHVRERFPGTECDAVKTDYRLFDFGGMYGVAVYVRMI